MSRAGSLRFDEAAFAEYCARRSRWQAGGVVVAQQQATQVASEAAHNRPIPGSTPGPASPQRPGAGPLATDDLPRTAVPVPGAPPLERDIQAAILELLAVHPRVAWARRMNTGGVERENADGTARYIAFAFEGCSDILGQLKDGRLLAVEVKRAPRKPTAAQSAFLDLVNRNGGVGVLAYSCDDVMAALQ